MNREEDKWNLSNTIYEQSDKSTTYFNKNYHVWTTYKSFWELYHNENPMKDREGPLAVTRYLWRINGHPCELKLNLTCKSY
jgi:hypothetical protein